MTTDFFEEDNSSFYYVIQNARKAVNLYESLKTTVDSADLPLLNLYCVIITATGDTLKRHIYDNFMRYRDTAVSEAMRQLMADTAFIEQLNTAAERFKTVTTAAEVT